MLSAQKSGLLFIETKDIVRAHRIIWEDCKTTSVKRGVNRGMQIRRSVVFLGPIRRSDLIFVQIRIRVTLKIFRGI